MGRGDKRIGPEREEGTATPLLFRCRQSGPPARPTAIPARPWAAGRGYFGERRRSRVGPRQRPRPPPRPSTCSAASRNSAATGNAANCSCTRSRYVHNCGRASSRRTLAQRGPARSGSAAATSASACARVGNDPSARNSVHAAATRCQARSSGPRRRTPAPPVATAWPPPSPGRSCDSRSCPALQIPLRPSPPSPGPPGGRRARAAPAGPHAARGSGRPGPRQPRGPAATAAR